MERHFISGYGDRSRHVSTALAQAAITEAANDLKDSAGAQERFARVARLIDGFDNPYGMELLASVHWVATNRDSAETVDEVRTVGLVHAWNEHKKIFRPNPIKAV